MDIIVFYGNREYFKYIIENSEDIYDFGVL
jgi:hypothetical protein